jgi:hypothetical protein
VSDLIRPPGPHALESVEDETEAELKLVGVLEARSNEVSGHAIQVRVVIRGDVREYGRTKLGQFRRRGKGQAALLYGKTMDVAIEGVVGVRRLCA